ncbi:Arv1 protein [Blastocladiella britannica]|nr:Arv1 protein [Blastocladiella britannica]
MDPQYVCVACGAPVPRLFTAYSPANVRLEQCPSCASFVDPYLECDLVLIFIDMLLHRTAAFRHILFNRAHRVDRMAAPGAPAPPIPAARRMAGLDPFVARFGLLLVLFDVYTRLLRMDLAQLPGAYASSWSTWRVWPSSGTGGIFNIGWAHRIVAACSRWVSGWIPMHPHFAVVGSVFGQYLHVLCSTVAEFAVMYGTLWVLLQFYARYQSRQLHAPYSTIPWSRFLDAMIISSFGRLLLILMVIWDPDRLLPNNLPYVWLINCYVVMTNAEALHSMTKIPHLVTLGAALVANYASHILVWEGLQATRGSN